MSTPGSPNNPDDPTEGASESGSSGGEGNPPGPGDTNILPPDEVHDLDEDMRPAASKTVKVQTADVEGADSSASKGSSEAGSTGSEESGSSDAGKSGEQGGSAGGGEGGGDEPPSGTAPSGGGGNNGRSENVRTILEVLDVIDSKVQSLSDIDVQGNRMQDTLSRSAAIMRLLMAGPLTDDDVEEIKKRVVALASNVETVVTRLHSMVARPGLGEALAAIDKFESRE